MLTITTVTSSVLLISFIAYRIVRVGDDRIEEIEQRKKQIHWPAAN
ncbi:hypothetical protein QCE47_28040 [Caballeronia sp. LZ025]|nr:MULTISPECIES: hypothetical protein [Caballeronia]MDR5736168.1 hypothetical protein [Caballeronia sp. LZ025]